MYPYSFLPKPLSHNEFNLLLALIYKPLHAYGIIGEIQKNSYGSMILTPGTVSALIMRMSEEGLIEWAGREPAGKSGKVRDHYRLTEYGTTRLQDEGRRLNQASRQPAKS